MFTVGAAVTISGTTHGWCLNHVVTKVHPLLAAAQSAPDRLPEGQCVACDSAARVVHLEDGDWNGDLCPGHALAYLSHSLSATAFHRILAEAGVDQNAIFALHDDFYTRDGDAWQPGGVSLSLLSARVRDLPSLPDFDSEGGFADQPDLHDELVQLARADYRCWSGLEEELSVFVADALVLGALMTEAFRREHPAYDPPRTPAQEAALRTALESLLAATIDSASDPATCLRLAGWMSERLSTRQDSAEIARILTLGLRLPGGWTAYDLAAGAENEHITGAAERIYREVLPMLASGTSVLIVPPDWTSDDAAEA